MASGSQCGGADRKQYRNVTVVVPACVARNRQLLDVPQDVVGDDALVAGEQIDVAQPGELGLLVGDQVDALSVARESGVAERRPVRCRVLSYFRCPKDGPMQR